MDFDGAICSVTLCSIVWMVCHVRKVSCRMYRCSESEATLSQGKETSVATILLILAVALPAKGRNAAFNWLLVPSRSSLPPYRLADQIIRVPVGQKNYF